MKKLTVDRIEEGFAVCECEDLSHISISVESFDFEVREGMIIRISDDGKYKEDTDEETSMKEKIAALQKKLMNKSDE